MRPIKPNTRRRPLWRTVLLAFLAIVVGGAGTVATLAGLKVIDLAKLFQKSKPTHPAGWVAFPLSARSIPAYTAVTRDFLMNVKTGTLQLDWRPPQDLPLVPKGAITETNLGKILNRVTAREKPAGYYFFESDFLPPGTHPGVAGGTPPGKRAITLDAAKLKGVHELKEGDHVNLLASIPVDMPGGHSNSGRFGANVVATPDVALVPKRSLVRPLVEDGVVVSPVTVRNLPTTSASSPTQGATTRNIPVQEIVLAVAPEEVGLLAEAMDMKYQITCVVRSGRPAPAVSPEAHPAAGGAAGRNVSGPGRFRQGNSGQRWRGRPGQGCTAARRSKNRQPHEERNAGQGAGGTGHHARTGSHGRDALDGSHHRESAAIHGLQRTGGQPDRGAASRRIEQGRCGGGAGGRAG